MNKLSAARRAAILTLLCEGNSLRAVSRITGVSLNTVTKLLIDVGRVCHEFHDRTVQGVKARRIQADKIWSFTHAKQHNVTGAKDTPEEAGDIWTWTALDADTKLVVGWLAGGRDAGYAHAFMEDVASRLTTCVQLTTDGYRPYLVAVEGVLSADVHYAILERLYGPSPESDESRCGPGDCVGIRKSRVEDQPNTAHISTCCVERHNLTMQVHMRRFNRLNSAFSRKVENHVYAVALHFVFYNFVRIHKALRCTPAMAAGLTDHLWEMSDIVALLERAEAVTASKQRGKYRNRQLKT